MFKNKTISVLLYFAAAPLFAASPDYFPLQVGNSWVYKVVQGRTVAADQTISVEGTETQNGREYFRLQVFGRKQLVRADETGSLFTLNEAGTENLWLPLGANAGDATQSEYEPCSIGATVRTRTAEVKIGLVDTNEALVLSYQPRCADAGVREQYFAPGVGLVKQESTTIAGPQVYELMYSRTGKTSLEAANVGFTIALDKPGYDRGTADMLVRLTVRSTHPEPVTLFFPSGQSYELRIWDGEGRVVYTWSADKLFIQATRRETFGPGERSFVFTVPIGQLRPGRYAAEANLLTQPGSYSGVAQFDIR